MRYDEFGNPIDDRASPDQFNRKALREAIEKEVRQEAKNERQDELLAELRDGQKQQQLWIHHLEDELKEMKRKQKNISNRLIANKEAVEEADWEEDEEWTDKIEEMYQDLSTFIEIARIWRKLKEKYPKLAKWAPWVAATSLSSGGIYAWLRTQFPFLP